MFHLVYQFLKIEAMEKNAKGLDKKRTGLKATGKKWCKWLQL